MPAPNPARDWVDAEGRVGIELRCAFCKYNLRTLPADSVCPECGQPVTASRPLAAYPPEVLQKLSRTLWWVFLAMVLACVRFVVEGVVEAMSSPASMAFPELGATTRVPLSWADGLAVIATLLLVPLGIALWRFVPAARDVVGQDWVVWIVRHAAWICVLGVLWPLLHYAGSVPGLFDVYICSGPLYVLLGSLVGWACLVTVLRFVLRAPAHRLAVALRVLLWLGYLVAGLQLSTSAWFSARWLGILRWQAPHAFKIPADAPAGATSFAHTENDAQRQWHYIIFHPDGCYTRTTTAPAAYLARRSLPPRPFGRAAEVASSIGDWAMRAWWVLALGAAFLVQRSVARVHRAANAATGSSAPAPAEAGPTTPRAP